ncbi:hypothetical protein thsps117_33570 [Pseudomonas sp. No.117]
MTSARLALVLVRIPLPSCRGPLPPFGSVATVELRSGRALDTRQVAAPSAALATSAVRQNAERARGRGIPPLSLDRRPCLPSLPAGVRVATHSRAAGGQPRVVTRQGAPWMSRHLVTPDHPQQSQRP